MVMHQVLKNTMTYTDATGTITKQYSRFEGGILVPGQPILILGFDLSNTFEAKITDKDSTKVEAVMLLNNLNYRQVTILMRTE
jgi:hypothetical protein